ncbi:MAG: NADH-quinone oxidoreductase subunit NuoE [Chloroflexota bacterium]|nr:NADH-quinone oxidoreductase subunit NuoE [Lentimicrobium sp.]
MSEILDEIIRRKMNVQRDNLLPLLQDIQNELGYLSEEAINRIGQITGLPTSKIYGVATFYDQFRFDPPGHFHIKVCHGTACHVSDSTRIIHELERLLKIKSGQTTRDGMYSLEVVNCMGACAVSPVININGDYFHGVDTKKVKEILESCTSKKTVYEGGE